MRQILNRHPALAICGETHFVPLVYARRQAFGDLGDPANRRRLIDEYLVNRHIKRAGLDKPELAERLAREGVSYKAMFTSILSYNAEVQGKRRVGEKSPQHGQYLKTLLEWFPGATVIHMIRDPRASVASMLHMPWSRGSVMANARQWMNVNRAACQFREQPGYLEVRYETLVADAESELRRICGFIGEEYSPLLLGDGRSSRAVTPERAEAWRSELTPREVAQIEWVAGPFMESIGYARAVAPASAATVVRGFIKAVFGYARFLIVRLPAVWYRLVSPAKLAKYDYWTGPRVWQKDGKRRLGDA